MFANFKNINASFMAIESSNPMTAEYSHSINNKMAWHESVNACDTQTSKSVVLTPVP